MLSGMPSTLRELGHLIPLSYAARGSKGREVQRIKPSVTLDLLAVEVELFAAADPALAQAPLVKRRRSIAIPQAATQLGIAARTADAWWSYAKAWFQAALQGP